MERRLTVTGIGIAVEPIAAAADVRADRVVAGCGGRASRRRSLHGARGTLVDVCKNTSFVALNRYFIDIRRPIPHPFRPFVTIGRD